MVEDDVGVSDEADTVVFEEDADKVVEDGVGVSDLDTDASFFARFAERNQVLTLTC